MSLHPSKSKCMLLSTKYKIKQARELRLSIENSMIENVQVHKLLGVVLDNTLSWKYQISKVCCKLNSKIALLKRIIYYLSDEMKIVFYNAYLVPCFDYCCTVWGKGISSKSDLSKISRIQKRAARIILKKPLRTCSSDMLHELKWLTFEDRCVYHMGLLIYKCKNKLVPKYLSDLITFSNNERYSLRSIERNDLVQIKPRTNYMKDTFSYSSTEIWKNIPLRIRNCSSVTSFKNNYKKLLLQIQNNQ